MSLAIGHGRIHGLVGGNGSGKSTLIKTLAGVHHGDPGGTIRIGSQAVAADATTPESARAHGLRFVHQDPGVFPTMTVAENLAMGGGKGFPTRAGRRPVVGAAGTHRGAARSVRDRRPSR